MFRHDPLTPQAGKGELGGTERNLCCSSASARAGTLHSCTDKCLLALTHRRLTPQIHAKAGAFPQPRGQGAAPLFISTVLQSLAPAPGEEQWLCHVRARHPWQPGRVGSFIISGTDEGTAKTTSRSAGAVWRRPHPLEPRAQHRPQ